MLIPISLAQGLLGALFQILYWAGKVSPFWSQLGWLMITQGVFLCLVMGIGGFLGPRLLGHQLFRIEGGRPITQMTPGNFRIAAHALAGLLLFASFVLEALGLRVIGYGLRAIVVTGEILWTTKIYKLPSNKDTYVKLFWISFWMIILGLWTQVLWPSYRMAALHLVFIGGFSLMTFTIATMVTLSHLGYGALLKKPLWVVSLFGAMLLAAMIVRSSADFHPRLYFHFLAAASVFWMIAAGGWLLFIIPKFFQAPKSLRQPAGSLHA